MRLIDADALTKRINDHLEMAREIASATEITHDMIVYANTGYMVKEFLKTQPTIEPERKTGKWIKHAIGHEHTPWGFDCSECGEWFVVGEEVIKKYNYCPNCGCSMKGETDERN